MRCGFHSLVRTLSWSISLALVACAAAPTKPVSPAPQSDVQASELPVPNSERYEQSPNIEYIRALSYPENPMPVYPADLLARRLKSAAIAVRPRIDATGVVSDVEAFDVNMTPGQKEFYSAVREVCRSWKFSPLIRVDRSSEPITVVEGDASVTYKGRPTPLPFHLDYAFHFSQHDGQPQVEVGSDK